MVHGKVSDGRFDGEYGHASFVVVVSEDEEGDDDDEENMFDHRLEIQKKCSCDGKGRPGVEMLEKEGKLVEL